MSSSNFEVVSRDAKSGRAKMVRDGGLCTVIERGVARCLAMLLFDPQPQSNKIDYIQQSLSIS